MELQDERACFEFFKEMEQLKNFHHPNVIQMLGVTFRETPSIHGGSRTEWMLVIECMSRDLFHWLHVDPKPHSWRLRVKVALEIAKAMVYLHSDLPSKAPVAHLDLKPGNILLQGEKLKVADFGLCRIGLHTTRPNSRRQRPDRHGTSGTEVGHESENEDIEETPEPGTAEYMAPEIYRGEGIGTAADVYSFAVILWEICCRRRPKEGFLLSDEASRGVPEQLLLIWVADGKRPKLPFGTFCPVAWRELMETCWAQAPIDRPKFKAVVQMMQINMVKQCPAWEQQRQLHDRGQHLPSPPICEGTDLTRTVATTKLQQKILGGSKQIATVGALQQPPPQKALSSTPSIPSDTIAAVTKHKDSTCSDGLAADARHEDDQAETNARHNGLLTSKRIMCLYIQYSTL